MGDLICTRTDCFYHAKGRCTSITALDAQGCAQFRAKGVARRYEPPRRTDLALIRRHLDQAFQARASLSGFNAYIPNISQSR